MPKDIDFSAFNNEQLLSKVEGVTGRIKDLKSNISLVNAEVKNLNDGIGTDLSNNFNRINSLVRDFNRLQSKAAKMGKSLKDITAKRVDAERQIYSLNIKSNDLYRQQQKAEADLLELVEKSKDLKGDAAIVQKEAIDQKRTEIDLIQQQGRVIRATSEEAQVVFSGFAELEETTIRTNDKFSSMFDIIGGISKQIPGLSALVEPFIQSNDLVRQQAVTNERLSGIYENGVISAEKLNEQKVIELGLAKHLLDGNDNILTGQDAINRLRELGMENALQSQGLMTTRFKAMGSAIQKSLIPLMIITTVVKSLRYFASILTGSQERSVELARQFGISRDSADGMRDSLLTSEKTINKTYASMTKLIAAQTMLVEELDRGGRFSTETLDALTLMSQRMGVSAEAATKVTARSEAFGGSARENVDTIMLMNNELYNSGQSTATFGQLMSAVGEASGQVAASFGFSNIAIARAVNGVRKLGLNLTQARNLSENLLDFESSIAAELEAELFLGKDINLDKARAMAMTGNIAGATSEVMKITQGLTKEQRKSPIVMQALADVIGLSVDELQDAFLLQTDRNRQALEQIKNQKAYLQALKIQQTLEKQNLVEIEQLKQKISDHDQNIETMSLKDYRLSKKRLNELTKENKENKIALEQKKAELGIADATAAGMADQVTAGEQLAAAMERVKDKFMELVGTGVLDKVVVLLTRFAEQGISGLFGGVKDYEIMPSKVSSQEQVDSYLNNLLSTNKLTSMKLAELRTQADEQGFTDKLDEFITSTTERGASALEKSYSNRNSAERIAASRSQRLLDALDGEPVLDDFIIRPGQGIQRFNKDDIVIGGTNLSGGNNKDVEKKLDAILAAIQAGGDVYIDGNKAGRAMVLGTQNFS